MGSRGRYLGSTNCADIMGCGFNSPLELYMQFVGLTPEKPATEAMQAGLYLEPAILKMTEDKLKVKITTGKEVQHWRHPDYEFLGGTDDGMIDPETGIDCKLVGPHQMREFGDADDDLPAKYILQANHNMLTGRRKRFVVSAFFVAEMSMPRIYRVERDEELCEMLLAREIHFWREHVLKKVPPAENDASIVKEYLSRRYPTHSADMLEANDELRELCYKLAHVRHEVKRLDAEKDSLENHLRLVIGNDEGITLDADNRVTWRKAKDSKKTDWFRAFQEISARVDESEAKAAIDKHTFPVVGSRRLLVHGALFDGDSVVADMRQKSLQ